MARDDSSTKLEERRLEKLWSFWQRQPEFSTP